MAVTTVGAKRVVEGGAAGGARGRSGVAGEPWRVGRRVWAGDGGVAEAAGGVECLGWGARGGVARAVRTETRLQDQVVNVSDKAEEVVRFGWSQLEMNTKLARSDRNQPARLHSPPTATGTRNCSE